MIAVAGGFSALRLDHRPEMAVRRLDRAGVRKGGADDDDAGAVRQRFRPLRDEFPARLGRAGGLAHRVAVVDQRVRHDLGGKRVGGRIDPAVDQRAEVFEAARGLGQEHPIGPRLPDLVVIHGVLPKSLAAAGAAWLPRQPATRPLHHPHSPSKDGRLSKPYGVVPLPRFACATRGGEAPRVSSLRVSAVEGDHAKHGGGGARHRPNALAVTNIGGWQSSARASAAWSGPRPIGSFPRSPRGA